MDTINTSTPQQFEAVRDQNKQIYWTGRPAFLPFILAGAPFLILGPLWGAMDYFGFIRHLVYGEGKRIVGFAIPFFALYLFPLWLSLLNMVRPLLVCRNTCYA